MSTRNEGLLMIGVLVILSFAFQLQMKQFATELTPILAKTGGTPLTKLSDIVTLSLGWRPLLIASLAVALFVVWLLALTRLDLSLALPLASVSLVVNSVGSGLILGEALTIARIAGILVIGGGITLLLKG
jgi:multidrug transporter EmrE-like cation transporter